MISDVEVRDTDDRGRGVFARRAFAEGEEMTIDYRLNAFDGDSWPCHCGAASCTGTVVGSFFAMSPERQRLLLPHAPAFIRRAYRRGEVPERWVRSDA